MTPRSENLDGQRSSYAIESSHLCPQCGAKTMPLPEALRAVETESLPFAGIVGANPEQIARWLRPPDIPTQERKVRKDIWDANFFSAVAIVVIILTGLMLYAILGPVSILITLGATFAVYRRARKLPARRHKTSSEHERTLAMKAWDRRMETWERLGVCTGCGKISDPVTGRMADWHSVPSLFV